MRTQTPKEICHFCDAFADTGCVNCQRPVCPGHAQPACPLCDDEKALVASNQAYRARALWNGLRYTVLGVTTVVGFFLAGLTGMANGYVALGIGGAMYGLLSLPWLRTRIEKRLIQSATKKYLAPGAAQKSLPGD